MGHGITLVEKPPFLTNKFQLHDLQLCFNWDFLIKKNNYGNY
jgi:hypothetical protein